MGRGNKWTSDEDELLCRAWIAVSEDPLSGTGQKAGKFWRRIHDFYISEVADGDNERNEAALTSRWNSIRASVSKFCGYFDKVKTTEHSGWSPEMYVDEARRLWKLQSVKGSEFGFQTCWEYLKTQRKWMVDIGAVSAAQEVSVEVESKSTVETPTRPIGQRSAKRMTRTPTGESDLQKKQHDEFIEVSKRKVKASEDRNAFNLFSMDPDSADSRRYFALKKRAYLKMLEEELGDDSEGEA